MTLTGALPRPRFTLVTVVTLLNGMMCTEPSPARSRMVRTDRFSTVPDRPETVTLSPTCMAFSSSRKMPVIRSCTSFCEPKPIATPMMPAPASSGAMLMPISDSTIMPATTTMVITRADRISGSSVRNRAGSRQLLVLGEFRQMPLDRRVGRFPRREGEQ